MSRAAFIFFVHVAAVAIVLGATVFFWTYGQDIESMLWPVVEVEKIDNIWRGLVVAKEREVEVGCFRLHIHKLRGGKPFQYVYEAAVPRYSDQTPVAAYLSDESRLKNSKKDYIDHDIGDRWNRDWCFEIPNTIADTQDIAVTGRAEHRRHIFWYTISPIRGFTICALDSKASPERQALGECDAPPSPSSSAR